MNSTTRFLTRAFALACVLFCLAFQPATAATTGLVFAGGCPESEQNNGLCVPGGNATEANVAALLGLDISLVSLVGEINDTNLTNPNFAVTGIDAQSGFWSVSNPSITHLAFKSDGHFILGEVTALSGFWMNDTSMAGSWDITVVDCPAAICDLTGARPYVDADFLNGGINVADLSNVRAFTAVPVPASVWLFGSALGLLAWIRRRAV